MPGTRPGIAEHSAAMYRPLTTAAVLFSRSRISLPVLKNGTDFCSTETWAPVRGLRPVRAGRCLTEKAPNPRNSTRSPRGHGVGDFAEDRVDDVLDVALIEMGILSGNSLDKFGLDH